ncbi:hypothetical protein [Actinospica sp.]|uniref:hypothetical protein n=1 Tax=Actinospica sp. TaxID=1872142 RepID=UPI002C7E0A16|nr:hypothetical protein [Actinospica sp.]HWG26295.1 hypothetical protein [Actinospica sp.]
MNVPAWLPVILAVVMLAIAAFSLWRMAMARALGLPVDYARDAVVFLLALAVSGMLVRWMHVLSPGIWALLIGAAGIGFAVRAALLSRRPEPGQSGAGTGAGTGAVRVALVAAGGCGIAVYMLLAGVAPSTINGSTAGYYAMAGMSDMYKDTTIAFPALGVALAVVLVGYAVAALDGITASAARGPSEGALAARSIAVCEIAIVVTMAFAILAKLV